MGIVKTRKLTTEQRFEECLASCKIDTKVFNLTNDFYNIHTSIIPFTHKKVTYGDEWYYEFDPDKTDGFIYELMECLDDFYCYNHRLSISRDPKKANFYRAFFYLAIRLMTMMCEDIENGNVTFYDFFEYAKASVTDLRLKEFENRYAALKFEDSAVCLMPGMLGKINDTLLVAEQSGFFLKADKASVAASKAYIEELKEGLDEEDLDEIEASREMYKSYLNATIAPDEEGIIDQDVFELAVVDYYKGLFSYGNYEMVGDVGDAITVFLIRNNQTIVDDKNKFDKAFGMLDKCSDLVKTYNDKKGKVTE